MREFLKYIPFEELRSKNGSSSVLRGGDEHIPIISLMGAIQGEILEFVEKNGTSTLRQILKKLQKPTHLVAMALGVLICSGLVRAEQGEKFISVWVDPHH